MTGDKMKLKLKYIVVNLLLIGIVTLLVSCKKEEVKEVTVRFTSVLPVNTPEEDSIYIAGTLTPFGLNEWDPVDSSAKLTKIEGRYTIEFTLSEETEYPITINYKYTRGDWSKVEKGSKGEEINNRSLVIDGSKALIEKEDYIMSWADLYENTGVNTVVGNLDIVTIEDDRFPNTSQQSRKLRIWTPENYDSTDLNKKYPVIYMHDAQNLFDKNTSFAGEWEVDETIIELMENYAFEGVIIVGIDNSAERMGEYVYNHDFLTGALGATKTGNYYMDFLVDIVKPYVDENYNTKPDRLNTYISGSSLGGLISIFGGLEYLEIFGGILAFSTSTQLVDAKELPQYFASLDVALLKETKYLFYVGTNGDGDVNWPEDYKELLVDLDVPEANIHIIVGENHQHNELAWRTFFPEAISWLFDLK